MENEKNINKKPDFGKFPLESFDKLEDYFKDLLSRLDNYENYIPEKLVNKILKEVGFESCDKNSVKLISLMADKLLNDIVQSIACTGTKQTIKLPNPTPEEINHLNNRSKAIKKTKGSVPKKFQLKNLLEEFEERGISIFRSIYYPNSELINKFIENDGKNS